MRVHNALGVNSLVHRTGSSLNNNEIQATPSEPEQDLFYPQPVEPKPLSWWNRHGHWVGITATMLASAGTAVGASFAAGGLVGRAVGLTFGAITGRFAGRFLSDLAVNKIYKGQPPSSAVKIGRAVGMTAGLALGWALSGTRLPDDVVVGPGVPALFMGMFGGIDWTMDHFYPKEVAHRNAMKEYGEQMEAWKVATGQLPNDDIAVKEGADYVQVGDVLLERD